MIVAIDGPAGSGKSSTAREVARRLGFHHVDSGAFYRAVTWTALETGLPEERWAALDAAALDGMRIGAVPVAHGFRMEVDGRDVSREIREPRVNAHVSAIARLPAVRDWLRQRMHGLRDNDLVIDGRDIGTVVFPDAEVKVFLVADPEARARRRLAETGVLAPSTDDVAAEVERLLARDRADSEREVAPLRRADDAVQLDTTGLGFDEQVERVIELVRSARA